MEQGKRGSGVGERGRNGGAKRGGRQDEAERGRGGKGDNEEDFGEKEGRYANSICDCARGE